MRTYLANGIVLKRINLAEKDRILTIYTREHGKLGAVAKGSRKPGSRLAGASEPFTYSKMQLASGQNLDVLTQADIRESFPTVKNSITSIAYAIYILELVSAFVDDRQANANLFDTLLSAMYVLESGTDPEITTRYFEINLLSMLGYDPHFDACLRCGHKTGKDKVAFSPSLGGIVCQDCGVVPSDAFWISGSAASYVQALRRTEPHKLKDLNFPKGAIHDLKRVFKLHIRYRLEHHLKSTDFIDTLACVES